MKKITCNTLWHRDIYHIKACITKHNYTITNTDSGKNIVIYRLGFFLPA